MNRTEETKFREQIDQWNDADEFARCIEAIEAIPEQERGYLLTVKLSRAYSNLAVLGDHSAHGRDGDVDGELLGHAIDRWSPFAFRERTTLTGTPGWATPA